VQSRGLFDIGVQGTYEHLSPDLRSLAADGVITLSLTALSLSLCDHTRQDTRTRTWSGRGIRGPFLRKNAALKAFDRSESCFTLLCL